MIDVIYNFFSLQLYERQYLTTFGKIAETITAEYIVRVQQEAAEKGHKPSFENMMELVRQLSTLLGEEAEKVCRDYLEEKKQRSSQLTKGCKQIIRDRLLHFTAAFT